MKTSKQSRYSYVLQAFRNQRWMIAGVFAIRMCISLLNALFPFITKFQVDYLESQSNAWLVGFSPFTSLAILMLFPVVIEIFRVRLFDNVSEALSSRFSFQLSANMMSLIWNKLRVMDVGFFQNNRNQRILESAFNATHVAQKFFDYIVSRFSNVVTLVAIIPLFGFVSWQLLVLILIVTVAQWWLQEKQRQQQLAMEIASEHHNERRWRIRRALLGDFHTLKQLGAIDTMIAEYGQLLAEETEHDIRIQKKRNTSSSIIWLLDKALISVAGLFVGWQVIQGQVTVGTFTMIISYAMQISGAFSSLIRSAQDWQAFELDMDRLSFFEMVVPRIKKSSDETAVPDEPQKLEFKDVHFKYPQLLEEERLYLELMLSRTKGYLKKTTDYYFKYDLEKWQELLKEQPTQELILKGVTLSLERGKVIALLGRNGAGKTTITHLAMHHYEPTKGKVLLDGKELYHYPSDEVVRTFGIIQQKPFVLDRFTVRENLLLGVSKEVDERDLWKVLSQLDLASVVRKLPKGLDTTLGESVNLSGGQRQAIAMARVLLQQRPFLIIDEGMSQMDIERERNVMRLLHQQAKHAGVLFITHRITTARRADKIYFMDKGKIVEEGTHQELLEKDGLYASFWKMQVIE